jgi:hypothetical protein
LFTLLPLVACWRYEPREHLRLLALAWPLVPPSPLRDRVGYSDHVRFRGYFPVHLIPAYNLPVYASQRPLPVVTQDSVRGCSLGFAAAVIADGRLQRAFKAQLPHHRAYGSVPRRFDRVRLAQAYGVGEDQENRIRDFVERVEPPGVRTCARVPSMNRQRPMRRTSRCQGGEAL